MDREQRIHLEKGLGAIVVPHCGDKDMVTVAYIVDVPSGPTKRMCVEALEIIRKQIEDYDKEVGGPVLELIGPKQWKVTVDFNEVDPYGRPGSISSD